MSITFCVGLFVTDPQGAFQTRYHDMHMLLGMGTGLLCFAAHIIVFMYFMATSRWIQAATDKANLKQLQYAEPALKHKTQAFALAMIAILSTMLTMIAGASTDVPLGSAPLIPPTVHMGIAMVMIATNGYIALRQFKIIQMQKKLMDDVLHILNDMPHVKIITEP